MEVILLEPSSDLCGYALSKAIEKYFEEHKEFPNGIIAAAIPFPMDLKATIVPDFPEDAWMVYGKKGIIYSPGV